MGCCTYLPKRSRSVVVAVVVGLLELVPSADKAVEERIEARCVVQRKVPSSARAGRMNKAASGVALVLLSL